MKISLLSFLLFLYFPFTFCTAQSKGWEAFVEMDNNIFPSYIIATATASPLLNEGNSRNTYSRVQKNAIGTLLEILGGNSNQTENNNTETIGDGDRTIGVKIVSPATIKKVKIEIAESSINYFSTFEDSFTQGSTSYVIYPKINYKFDALRHIRQSTPVNLEYRLYVNGEYWGQKLKTTSVRGLNECPIAFVDRNGVLNKTSWMFAAYVDEDNPLIDEILKDALGSKMVNSFDGYQSGNGLNVLTQVAAIWYTLQKKKTKYSSITNTSLSSDKVISQRVRLINNSVQNSQANCVDGSVLMASILLSIGIKPVLILVPSHMYLGFYTENSTSGDKFQAIETTMMGSVDLDNLVLLN